MKTIIVYKKIGLHKLHKAINGDKKIDATHKNVNEETALHSLCSSAYVSVPMIEFLLEKKCSLKEKNKDESTMVHLACKKNTDVKVVRFLMDRFQVDMNSENKYGNAVLHGAVHQGIKKKKELVKYLLEKKAQANVRGARTSPLLALLSNSNNREDPHSFFQTIKLLVDYKAEVQLKDRKHSSNSLLYALLRNQKDHRLDILHFLIDSRCDIDFQHKTTSMNTALHFACSNNLHKVVQVLLLAGASAELKNGENKTAKDICLKSKNEKMRKLVEHPETWQKWCVKHHNLFPRASRRAVVTFLFAMRVVCERFKLRVPRPLVHHIIASFCSFPSYANLGIQNK